MLTLHNNFVNQQSYTIMALIKCRVNGVLFCTAAVDSKLLQELSQGDVISFTYTHLSALGAPVRPVIIKRRSDLLWENVILRKANQIHHQQSIAMTLNSPNSRLPFGFWKRDEGANMRRFLDSFASEIGFDPLVATNWSFFTSKDIVDYGVRWHNHTAGIHFKQGSAVLNNFNGSYMQMIFSIYSDAQFDRQQGKTPNTKPK